MLSEVFPVIKLDRQLRKTWPGRIFAAIGEWTRVAEFIRRSEGSVAVETAACIGPLVMTVFVLLNLSIIFTGKQVLSAAVDQVVREMKVEIRQGKSVTANDISRSLCDNVRQFYLIDCESIDIGLQSFRTIQTAATTSFPSSADIAGPPVRSGDVVRLVATYRWSEMFRVLPSFVPIPSGLSENREVRTWINE